jgi:hypothetical protein
MLGRSIEWLVGIHKQKMTILKSFFLHLFFGSMFPNNNKKNGKSKKNTERVGGSE